MYSILLIGQSNAAGRGVMTEVEPLDTDRQFVQRCGKWRPMYTPINPDRINAGTCLAESFAYRFVHHYNTDVGIIPCAYGGSKIGEWMPGEPLYENAVFQAKLAQRDSEIVGVLWHQGESDSFPDRYESWSKKCIFVFESLRKELNLGTDVPFLVGGLGDYLIDYEGHLGQIRKYFMFINEQMIAMAEDNDYIGFVPATGLAANPDNLHFSAAGLREFGEQYFEKFVSMSKLIPAEGCIKFEGHDDMFEKSAKS